MVQCFRQRVFGIDLITLVSCDPNPFPESLEFSVSSGDGRNPSPLGEEKIVVLWSRASLQARSAHENGPKSAHRLDTEIS